MESSKHSIREELSAARRALAADAVARARVAVLTHVQGFDCYATAPVVLAYVAKDNEVPVDLVVADALRCGKHVYLPSVRCAAFVRYRPELGLVRGPWGVQEPAGDVEFDERDGAAVALVPVVAWDAAGRRLGRGGGWYDRVLARLRSAVTAVGVGYAFQERAGLPQSAQDVVLDFMVTENGLMRCGGGTWVGDIPARRDA